jgi:transcriptional regulator with XRE-family HTH domain
MKKQTVIARAIEDQGLSVAMVARDVGVTKAAVYKWIHGIGMPAADRMNQVCNYLGLTPNEVYGWKK